MSAIHGVIILRPERDFGRVKAPTANMVERSLLPESQRAGETVAAFSIGTVAPPWAAGYKSTPQFYGRAANGG